MPSQIVCPITLHCIAYIGPMQWFHNCYWNSGNIFLGQWSKTKILPMMCCWTAVQFHLNLAFKRCHLDKRMEAPVVFNITFPHLCESFVDIFSGHWNESCQGLGTSLEWTGDKGRLISIRAKHKSWPLFLTRPITFVWPEGDDNPYISVFVHNSILYLFLWEKSVLCCCKGILSSWISPGHKSFVYGACYAS